eukprot:6617849-Pyramimonas_sp.AAC.1
MGQRSRRIYCHTSSGSITTKLGKSPPPREPQPHRSLWGEANPLNDGVATHLDNGDFDSGTDADTISSDGIEPLGWSDIMQMERDNQRAEHLFWLLQQAKR